MDIYGYESLPLKNQIQNHIRPAYEIHDTNT